MANAKEEGLEEKSSTDGRASRKSGHSRWSQGVLLSLFLGDERLDKVEVSGARQKFRQCYQASQCKLFQQRVVATSRNLHLQVKVRTNLPHLSSSRSLTHSPDLWVLDPYTPCDDPRQSGGSTQIPSLTGYEPKVIEPNDLEPRRIELDRNLGTDLHQTQERILGDDYQNLSQKIRKRLENFMSTCPTSNQEYTPFTIQLKALQTRILKMENYEECWSPLYAQSREDCESSRIQVQRRNLLHCYLQGTRSRGNTEERCKRKSYSS